MADRTREFAAQISDRLSTLKRQEKDGFAVQRTNLEEERLRLVGRQKAERTILTQKQTARWQEETSARQARYTRGLRGVVDRLSGQHKRIRASNEMQTYLARLRDRKEQDGLIFRHVEERKTLYLKARLRLEQYKATRRVLRIDAAHLQNLALNPLPNVEKEPLKAKQPRLRDRDLSLQ